MKRVRVDLSGLTISAPGYDLTMATGRQLLVSPTTLNEAAVITGTLLAGTSLPILSSTYLGDFVVTQYHDTTNCYYCVFGTRIAHGLGYTPIVWTDSQGQSAYGDGKTFGNWQSGYQSFPGTYSTIMVDSTYVTLGAIGWYTTHTSYGSGSNYSLPTYASPSVDIHYACLSAPVG